MRCEVRYEKSIRRGVCYAPHHDGGGHYVRLPLWEMMVLAASVVLLALFFMVFMLVYGVVGLFYDMEKTS